TFTSVEQTYFRRGFGLKGRITSALTADYHSRLVDLMREHGYALTVGDLTFKLAREFGFCYGVDRAVEYAYETRAQFPDRRIFLSGEIIHNPDVNGRIEKMGIKLLADDADPAMRYRDVQPDDVVLLPAFGVTTGEM